jgi:hypothetical protein
MAHSGFGNVTIISGNSVVTIPQGSALAKTGKVKKGVNARLKELTIGGAQLLNKQYGITIEPRL